MMSFYGWRNKQIIVYLSTWWILSSNKNKCCLEQLSCQKVIIWYKILALSEEHCSWLCACQEWRSSVSFHKRTNYSNLVTWSKPNNFQKASSPISSHWWFIFWQRNNLAEDHNYVQQYQTIKILRRNVNTSS